MTTPLKPEDPREAAKQRARQLIASGAIKSAEELQSYMASQGVQPRAATPRTGFADRTPTATEPAGGYGMLAKIGKGITKAADAVVGMGWRAADELSGGFMDEYANSIRPGLADAANARVQETTPAVMRGLGSLMGAVGQGAALAELAPAALVAKANKGRSILDAALRAGAGGAAGGAMAGAGHAEGGPADRALGALIGGGIGGVAGLGFAGAGGLVNAARNTVAPSAARVAGEGDRVFGDLLRRAGKTDVEAQAELAALRGRGVDARAADVLGRPGQKMLGLIEAKSEGGAEAAAKALGARQRDSGDHLAGRFLAAAKQGEAPDAIAMVEDITARRSANAEPMYREAFAKGASVTDPDVRAILAEPRWRDAFQEAQQLVPRGEAPLAPIYDAKGNVLPEVDLRSLHWAKVGVDENMSKANMKMSTGRRLRRKIADEVRSVRDAAKAASPEYAAAAREYADDSELLDAVELGRGFMAKSPNQVAHDLKGLSDAQREAYQAQALDEITKRIGDVKGTGDPSRMFDSKNWTQRIHTLFGDRADEVMQGIRDVEQTSSTFRALSGSRTVPLLAAEEQMANMGSQMGADFTRGRVATGLFRPLAAFAQRQAHGVSGKVGEDVLQRLMAEDVTLQRALDDLSARRGLRTGAAAGNFVTSNLFGGH